MTRRAFTLVEMVVAIGIIVLLAVLTITATVALVERSEVRRTEDVIRLVDMALQEWGAQADRKLTWGEQDHPRADVTYDLHNGTPHVFTVTEMLAAIRRTAAARDILAQIAPEFTHTYDMNAAGFPAWLPANPDLSDPDPFVQGGGIVQDVRDDFDGEITILDAWGIPLRVVHPGRLFHQLDDDQGYSADLDGTVFIDDEDHDYEGVVFYGTEQLYGTALSRKVLVISAGPDGKFGNLSDANTHNAAHDNIYSYVVEDDHDQP